MCAPLFSRKTKPSLVSTDEVRTGVVVVGGGPAGYSVAIALTQQGFRNILILERAPSANDFNPSMGFVYNISGPGKAVLRGIGVNEIEKVGAPPLLLPVCCYTVACSRYLLLSFLTAEFAASGLLLLHGCSTCAVAVGVRTYRVRAGCCCSRAHSVLFSKHLQKVGNSSVLHPHQCSTSVAII